MPKEIILVMLTSAINAACSGAPTARTAVKISAVKPTLNETCFDQRELMSLGKCSLETEFKCIEIDIEGLLISLLTFKVFGLDRFHCTSIKIKNISKPCFLYFIFI